MRSWIPVLVLGLMVPPLVSDARAQEDPSSSARFVIGPLYLTPTIGIREIGIDSNVFNESEAPRDDFTMTVTPQVNAGMRLGRARLSTISTFDFVYYQTYKNQESINNQHQVQLEVPLERVRPFFGADLLETRSRPGFEIDTRAQRSEPTLRFGTDLQISSRLTLSLGGRRSWTRFDDNQEFRGADLQNVLNRRAAAFGGTLRFAATPLTTVLLVTEGERVRFDFDTLRDADSIRVVPGLEFHPDALLNGRANVGFRRFKALGAAVPSYTGLIANVMLSYVFLGRTRVEGRLDRDVAYSYEELTPYYLITGGALTVTQRLFGPIDGNIGASRQVLSYRARTGLEVGDREDRVHSIGAGIGYHLGETARLGLNVEYVERRSDNVENRYYDRTRIFGTVTYGFR